MSTPCLAQPIEQVIVETYHVQASEDGGAPLTTYRIFLDLAPDHALQMIYGDDHHSMRIESSTYFYNTTTGSVKYGDRLVIDPKFFDALANDSWLTIGMVGAAHVGVPRELDPDGSLLECSPIPFPTVEQNGKPMVDPLCVADGVVLADEEREVVNFRHESGYLGTAKGTVMETRDGAWAMLGGMKGATKENIVLVGQIATTGELHFILNAQVGTPDGGYVKVVAADPQEGELLFEQLTYGKRPVY